MAIPFIYGLDLYFLQLAINTLKLCLQLFGTALAEFVVLAATV
jgi:hypothetical protein